MLNIATGAIMRTSVGTTGTTTIQDGILTAGASNAGGELFFVVNNTGDHDHFGLDPGQRRRLRSLVKGGIGTAGLILSGANTYSGGTFVNSGTLTLSTRRRRRRWRPSPCLAT